MPPTKEMAKAVNWILVTGTPRSGTTFVGKVLSAPLQVGYLHEPFNPYCGMPGIDQLYLYLRVHGRQQGPYNDAIERIFACDFRLRAFSFRKEAAWRSAVKKLIGSRHAWSARFAKFNPFLRAIVIKDPIACLSTEYLFENFGVSPVVVVRHPLGVVASALRLKWNMNLDPIRQQPDLVEDYFHDDRELLLPRKAEPFEQAAYLWRALNKVLLSQAHRHPSWQVVTHEAICSDPVREFRALYETLDLPWTSGVAGKIVGLTSPSRACEAFEASPHDELRRNSASLFAQSLKMLSSWQRTRVYEITKEVAGMIYSKESFALDDEVEAEALGAVR